ncbi:MAG: tetratricopeptide repeat protein [Candidatus Thorarchaeota archaeon]
MDPNGTITMYFPFIDEETKEVLESIMTEASDYYDFVNKLCERVLNNDSPVMVVYFAIHHSILAMEHGLIDKIREKYGHHQILGPNLFYSSVHVGNYDDAQKAKELADAIIATDPEDWIAIEMNLIKFEIDMRNYPKTMYKTSTMDRIRELIDTNPNFGFYETVLCDFLSIRAQIDGDTEERRRCIDQGIKIAREFDDKYKIAHLLIRKGSFSMNFDRLESRAALEEAYQIVDSSIGIPVNYAYIIYYLSLLDAIRGDFDRAIEQCSNAVTILERAGLESGNPSSFLSIFYNIIGEPESGLEWGRMTEDQFSGRPYLINHARLFQIWSLILLKRLIEAQALLDSSRESIVKGGNEDQLAWLHFVTGILEMEQGDFPLALSSIEQGLKIYEQQGTALLMENIFLHQLSLIEIMTCSPGEAVSPSLAILEERALSEDLPGILCQVLLLKADMAVQNKDEEQLRAIIPKIGLLMQEHKLHFLEPRFESLTRRL